MHNDAPPNSGNEIKGYYPTLFEFLETVLSEGEEILENVRRSEIVEFAGVANKGKTTLLLFLAALLHKSK